MRDARRRHFRPRIDVEPSVVSKVEEDLLAILRVRLKPARRSLDPVEANNSINTALKSEMCDSACNSNESCRIVLIKSRDMGTWGKCLQCLFIHTLHF